MDTCPGKNEKPQPLIWTKSADRFLEFLKNTAKGVCCSKLN